MRLFLSIIAIAFCASPVFSATYQYSGGLLNQTYSRGPLAVEYEFVGPLEQERLEIQFDADLLANTSYDFELRDLKISFVPDQWLAQGWVNQSSFSGGLRVQTDQQRNIVSWRFGAILGAVDFIEVSTSDTDGDYLYYGYEYAVLNAPPSDDNLTSRENSEARARAGSWERITPVPVPASAIMLLLGIAALGNLRRKTRAV